MVVGRQSAGAGFLDAYVRHSGHRELVAVCPSAPMGVDLAARARRVDPGVTTRALAMHELDALADVGCLHVPSPVLGDWAWLRRRGDERAYSLTGVTHTVSTERVMRAIRDYLTAPLQPWDALVCTSSSAKQAVVRTIESWRSYLGSRGFGVPELSLQLPVIPLGVDLERFAPDEAKRAAGRALRQRLGIEDDAVVVLYFGRIAVQNKAHPTPMFQALELAQRASVDRMLHFVLCGQVAEPVLQRELDAARAAFCPSVPVHLLDGTDAEASRAAWYAADLFLSLSDNVQESFGLTTIEAQAAGLPVVAGDWNGYRETVAAGETGFLARTWTPGPGAGLIFADEHAVRTIDQASVMALAAQSTAIDLDEVAHAIARLATDEALRRRMSDAARRRAHALFDWRTVLHAYQDLWGDLAARRAAAAPPPPRAPHEGAHPDYPDPYWVFEQHPTGTLQDAVRCFVAEPDVGAALRRARHGAIHLFASARMVDLDAVAAWITSRGEGPFTVSDAVAALGGDRHAALRTLGWLGKLGLLRFEAP